MFNRYWREYPWFLQLILFGLMVFTFASFTTLVCTMLWPKLMGYSVAQAATVGADASKSLINASIILQGVISMSVFLLPPLVYANQTHPSVTYYLHLQKPGKPIQWILILLMWLGAMPLFLELGSLMHLIDLGKGAKEAQDKIEAAEKAYLDMKTFGEFLRALIVMALLPAIGEELFFRGILFRFFYQKNRRIFFSGFLVSVLFALAHGTPFNYVSIFAAGGLLCFTFYITGSLYASMLAHFFYNGLQIFLAYIAQQNASIERIMDQNAVPLGLVAGGAVLFAASAYLLWKARTPLPPTWADDFTPQERAERETNPFG
ncbi:MAG: hypothetical protein BGO70_07895 [Bacteroidetes bacterium 43-93]|nr:CPBP family intramembrane metalloprotease [Bacteroidota bacterium]OJW97692.1 MAG: hypothetical protein BGO70_07895 [Bacteroidetes bacterium 43-93]